jgi:hypothetical protein
MYRIIYFIIGAALMSISGGYAADAIAAHVAAPIVITAVIVLIDIAACLVIIGAVWWLVPVKNIITANMPRCAS